MSRTVLVTGAARGIGLAIARAFVANGDKVAITYNASVPPDDLFAVRCDVTDATSVDSAFEAVEAQFGGIEIVVSNAGITHDTLLLRMSEADFTSVLDANLAGAFRVAKRAAPKMVRARAGRLIFISSVVGFMGSTGQANYAASKSGLVGLARSLARELASRNITVNVVAPGPISTDMTEVLSSERRDELARAVPLARFGTPEEVAAAVVFLASPAAAYITGAVVPVDGGLAMGM